jgi:hypothetical protein
MKFHHVDCAAGQDKVTADKNDRPQGCEKVTWKTELAA